MTRMEIDALEQTSRTATTWFPGGYDGRVHFGAVLGAMVPAIGILIAAAVVLFHF